MSNAQFIWLGKVLLGIWFTLITGKNAKNSQVQLSIKGQMEKQLNAMEE